MRRREIFALAGGAILARTVSAQAQATVAPVVGFLAIGTPDWVMKATRAGLEEGGYTDGRNVTLMIRSAEGQFDRLPALASELVGSQVAVIFATGSPVPARAAKAATATIPIVFAYGGDPVADGLVNSLNQPGGNVTGATFIGSALVGKRMELLRQLVPQAVDIAMLVNPKGTLAERQIADARAAADKLGQRLQLLNTTTPAELDAAFAAMKDMKAGAFITSTDPFFGFIGRERMLALAKEYKMPAIFNGSAEPIAGGLAGYGPSLPDTWRQAAVYVTRIPKGAKPAELPVMQPTKFEFVINLKTARELGLTLSPTVLSLADEVIE
jgi:putative tryptophan/tyrosine transport system substrate-binding protein